MDRIRLSDQLDLSRLVYGTWRLADDKDISAAKVQAKVEACLEQGITTLDQADIYGGYTAEELLGGAFRAAPGLRDRCEIVTKCDIVAPVGRHAAARVKHYDTSREHIEESVHQSLRAMDTEHLDLLLIHRPDPLMDHHETGRTLDDLVAAGKVGSVGVSNFRPWDWSLLQSAMKTPLVTNQIELSLNRLEPFTNGDLAFLQEKGIPPMAWSPLGGGSLMSGESDQKGLRPTLARIAQEQRVDIAAVAVAWLLAHPARVIPVMGTNNLDRIAALGDALKVGLDRETWFELYTHALGHEVP